MTFRSRQSFIQIHLQPTFHKVSQSTACSLCIVSDTTAEVPNGLTDAIAIDNHLKLSYFTIIHQEEGGKKVETITTLRYYEGGCERVEPGMQTSDYYCCWQGFGIARTFLSKRAGLLGQSGVQPKLVCHSSDVTQTEFKHIDRETFLTKNPRKRGCVW